MIREFAFYAERDFSDRCTDQFARKKKDDDHNVFHVHMRPVTPGAAQDKWDDLWDRSFIRGKEYFASQRTSDCYLLYTHSEIRGYYLIDILYDPGAHSSLWAGAEGAELRNFYGEWAETFLTHGTL